MDESEGSTTTGRDALLFRLDRLGLLVRSLSSRGRRLASCVPLRPPPAVTLEGLLEEPLRLSPHAYARAEGKIITLEAPGSWARMTFHERSLLPLLYDLAVGRHASQMAAATTEICKEAILAVLALMSRCWLLETTEQEGWSGHDLRFHTRTRWGYARAALGKINPEGEIVAQSAREASAQSIHRLALERPDLPRLLTTDPPYALVSERRQSVRRHGSVPLTSAQLSEFLFRTLCERSGRRPYPSGGACYPLKAYLAVHRCRGVRPGFYSYDSAVHELIFAAEPGHRLDKLLADAASAANVDQRPQVLLVLAARYSHVRRSYGDLSYSLILKEVGAVFQTAMMAAAAMRLATCPLGCGDSVLFSELIGENPHTETSVGELMLGSLD
ncbi:SagB family peptide dehydrogenase [Bradyrhizobium sp. McL0616]|uniref:SagB family peptide dehydrogenase n=1 Tax=Bradyrhizobium sp. McL0616 TaxID=3415674 RepID=UPI003CF35F11